MNVHTLIIESEYGESEFHFNEPMCLNSVYDMLVSLGSRPEVITEAKGTTRAYYPWLFVDIFELETKLLETGVFDNYESGITEAPNNLCPALANLATLCDESNKCYEEVIREHDKETSSVGGAVSEGTEEKEEQRNQIAKSDQLHPLDIGDVSRRSPAQCHQGQGKAGGDTGDIQAHHAGDEMTGNEKLLYGVNNHAGDEMNQKKEEQQVQRIENGIALIFILVFVHFLPCLPPFP